MVSRSDITAIAQTLGRQFSVDQVVLFGSYARDVATEDSDVDLLVVVPQAVADPDRLYVQMRKAIAPQGPIPVDLVIRSRDAVNRWAHVPYSLIHEAVKDGRVLYARRAC